MYFIYRYISCESSSQFDSLPLTSLLLPEKRAATAAAAANAAETEAAVTSSARMALLHRLQPHLLEHHGEEHLSTDAGGAAVTAELRRSGGFNDSPPEGPEHGPERRSKASDTPPDAAPAESASPLLSAVSAILEREDRAIAALLGSLTQICFDAAASPNRSAYSSGTGASAHETSTFRTREPSRTQRRGAEGHVPWPENGSPRREFPPGLTAATRTAYAYD